MAAADKARFYLEQYVPELQEYAQKGIFSREEITAITSKRSGFEHTLNARGSTPADYARYATYEMNLDALRKKRCKRLGIKNATTFNGQRTVFFVLDRATKKFPGDMGLWMQYIDFCKKEKANTKLAKVFTNVLRLHPRDWKLWVLAAKYYAEVQGDMSTARSYLQRGLRFCRNESKLYLEYAKLEMVYLAKLAARKKILGLDGSRAQDGEPMEEDENFTALPVVTAEDVAPEADESVEEVNEDALKKLQDAPALTGAIPVAIFDAAMKQFADTSPAVALEFFDLISIFDALPPARRILQHILNSLQKSAPSSPEAIICEAKSELFAVDVESADFPVSLGKALAHIKQGAEQVSVKHRSDLADKAVLLLLDLLINANNEQRELDSDVSRVIQASIKRYLRTSVQAMSNRGRKNGPSSLVTKLEKSGKEVQARVLTGLVEEARLD